ncbi:MAG: ABC transporter ATP-binding protein [Halodesulfovibrio sp.]
MSQQPLIALRNINKIYGQPPSEFHALKDISVSAHAGEMLLLMGPSGSGKTTLLSIMGCILSPTSGQIAVAGEDVTTMNRHQMARVRLKHIGFIFQDYNLFPALTVLDNLLVTLRLQDITGRKAKDSALASLDAVGLSGKTGLYPDTLSGGQKQRLAIARSLVSEPDIILADEPTAALDSENGQKVMELMTTLCRTRGKAVVIVTHDQRIKRFASRVALIEDGRIKEGAQ